MPEKFPESSEEGPEDVYARGGLLSDFFNVLSGAGIHDNGKIYRYGEIKTVQEHYYPNNDAMAREIKKYAEKHPRKIERINKMTNILNTTSDVNIFKQAWNEVTRLVYDKEISLVFKEPESDPDLLEI
jgi:hypothetical protein